MKKFFILVLLFTPSWILAKFQTRTINFSLMAPDSSWSATISDVYKVRDMLYVVVRLRSEGIGTEQPRGIAASINVSVPDLPIRYYVTGKTWTWNQSTYQYTAISDEDLMKQLRSATLIWTRSSKEK